MTLPWSGNSVDMLSIAPRFLATTKLMRASLCSHGLTKTFILCCSIALYLHKFEKRRQDYTNFHKPPNFFVSFLHFQPISPFFLFATSRILCNFALESIKSSHLRMDSPTELGSPTERQATISITLPRWSVRCGSNNIHFKTKSYATAHLLHQVCSAFRRHADSRLGLGFAACHSKSLFNAQVQNRGWSSMRAYHDQALIDEFQRRGIDTTPVYDGKTIFFVHPVRYDLPNNKLVVISWTYTIAAFAVCSCKGGRLSSDGYSSQLSSRTRDRFQSLLSYQR